MKIIFIILMNCYLNMAARVDIGKVRFDNINSFTVTQSVKELSDSCTITLAKNYKLLAGKPARDYISAGMPVTVSAGYNGELLTEFTGFVKPGISDAFPLVIECDELYPLRQNNYTISYKTVTLKELLTKVAPGYTIECPIVDLGKLVLHDASSLEVLKHIRDTWGLFARINGDTLSVGWPYDYRPSFTKNHKYVIGENVKDYKNLKWRTDNDFNTKVTVTIHGTDGKKKFVKSDSDFATEGKIIKVDRKGITEATAKALANSLAKQNNNYAGYTGYITGFDSPQVNAGDSITIVDKANPERQGTYLVERVVIDYSEAHINRNCYISYKAA